VWPAGGLGPATPQERFSGVSTVNAASGAILLDGAPVWLECAVEHSYPAADQDIISLRVLAMMSDDERKSAGRHRRTPTLLGP
jgi:flavin reductase (DIM6/NTAB) family NADH-FMN oxidoreductase RutF